MARTVLERVCSVEGISPLNKFAKALQSQAYRWWALGTAQDAIEKGSGDNSRAQAKLCAREAESVALSTRHKTMKMWPITKNVAKVNK